MEDKTGGGTEEIIIVQEERGDEVDGRFQLSNASSKRSYSQAGVDLGISPLVYRKEIVHERWRTQ